MTSPAKPLHSFPLSAKWKGGTRSGAGAKAGDALSAREFQQTNKSDSNWSWLFNYHCALTIPNNVGDRTVLPKCSVVGLVLKQIAAFNGESMISSSHAL